MNRSTLQRSTGGLIILLAAWATVACGQDFVPARPAANAPDTPAAATVPATPVPAAATETDVPGRSAGTPGEPRSHVAFWPDLGPQTLAWFAALAILALTLRPRPLICARNLDGLVLAAMCLLLPLRGQTMAACDGGHTWQWWSYLGLAVAVGYWLIRGIGALVTRKPVLAGSRPSTGALFVLLCAGLAISIHHLATAPLSAGSRDGVIGGIHTAMSGELPYGEVADPSGRSPLLHLLHAGAVMFMAPTLPEGDELMRDSLAATTPEAWLAAPWWDWAEQSVARPVNALLLALMLLGLCLLGRRLHDTESGVLLVALFCLFPGAVENLSHPEIMLPAVLLVWTLILAMLPGVGGLLGSLCLVSAGLAWPWAWLGLPVLLGYFWRRSWQGFGSVVGTVGGLTLIVLGLMQLVPPALPRADGALAAAGLQPLYEARLSDDGTLVVDRRGVESEQVESQVLTQHLWSYLVTGETAALKGAAETHAGLAIDWPNDVNGDTVWYRQVTPRADARRVLQTAYREAVALSPPATQLTVALRTVLESTWLSATEPHVAVEPAWQFWGGKPLSSAWLSARRLTKLGAGLITLWATLAVFLGNRARPRHVTAALLVVGCAALLASAEGAVANLAWLTPLILALWAIHDEVPMAPRAARPARVRERLAADPPPADLGAPPRITTD